MASKFGFAALCSDSDNSNSDSDCSDVEIDQVDQVAKPSTPGGGNSANDVVAQMRAQMSHVNQFETGEFSQVPKKKAGGKVSLV